MSNHHHRGLVIVYTGNGKGKTTAAIGLAVRAIGYKRKVLFLQFIKEWFTGERESLESLKPYITFLQMGEGFVGIWGDRKDRADHVNAAGRALAFAVDQLQSGLYDVVILDEINVAVSEKLISLADVLHLLDCRPVHVDVVLTGRGASQEIIDRADLVTEMHEIKHPFQKGILAKRSIDY